MTYYSVLAVTPTTDAWVADHIGPKARTEGSVSYHFLIEGKDDLA